MDETSQLFPQNSVWTSRKNEWQQGSLPVIVKQRRPAHQFLVRLGVDLRKRQHVVDERVRAEAVDEEALVPRLCVVEVETAFAQNLKGVLPRQTRLLSLSHATPR